MKSTAEVLVAPDLPLAVQPQGGQSSAKTTSASPAEVSLLVTTTNGHEIAPFWWLVTRRTSQDSFAQVSEQDGLWTWTTGSGVSGDLPSHPASSRCLQTTIDITPLRPFGLLGCKVSPESVGFSLQSLSCRLWYGRTMISACMLHLRLLAHSTMRRVKHDVT